MRSEKLKPVSQKMAVVARAQIRAISKRLFSSFSISHSPLPQITADKDKFSFLDAVDVPPLPATDFQNSHVFIKRSCLKCDATDQEKMDFYVKTAAQVVGSEEEAKKRIYKITRDYSLCGFGFERCYTGKKDFGDLPCVERVDNEYTGEDFINGELVTWSYLTPKREKGRFPLPNPDIKHLLESDTDSASESDDDEAFSTTYI